MLVELRHVSGRPVYLNPRHVVSLERGPGLHPAGMKPEDAQVFTTMVTLAVGEDVEVEGTPTETMKRFGNTR